jgi:hypothetical protein
MAVHRLFCEVARLERENERLRTAEALLIRTRPTIKSYCGCEAYDEPADDVGMVVCWKCERTLVDVAGASDENNLTTPEEGQP